MYLHVIAEGYESHCTQGYTMLATVCSLLFLLTFRVKGVSESQLTVESGRFKGRVHITMVTDDPSGEDSPLSAYKPSDIIKARVLKIRQAPGHKAALELCTMERWVM